MDVYPGCIRNYNPDFNPLEFEGVRKQAGANAFTMSLKKWIEATDAAMSFATWISPEFQLYIMKD